MRFRGMVLPTWSNSTAPVVYHTSDGGHTWAIQTVANPIVTLIDDPTNPLAYSATDVDGEGLAARRNVLIENGMLRQFVHSSYSGRRSGSASTGNATRGGFKGTPGCGCLAMQLQPGGRSQPDIIAKRQN